MARKRSVINKEEFNRNFAAQNYKIVTLCLLFLLQGVPMGFAMSVRTILNRKNVDQGMFSIVDWPVYIKMLWAPLIDCYYLKKLGRYRSWLICTELFLGLFMILCSSELINLLGCDDDDSSTNISMLTFIFCTINFFCSSHDVALNGWMTITLSRKKAHHAVLYNFIGLTVGCFIGDYLFMLAEGIQYHRKCFTLMPGLESKLHISSLFKMTGLFFIISALVFLSLKKEDRNLQRCSIKDTYHQLYYSMMHLQPIQHLMTVLLTYQIAFAFADSAALFLHMADAGVNMEIFVLSVIIFPLQILLSESTVNTSPYFVFVKAYRLRLIGGSILSAIMYWWTDFSSAPYSVVFYAASLIVYSLDKLMYNIILVSMMALFADVSRKYVAGSVIAILHTVRLIGKYWIPPLVLWILRPFVTSISKMFDIADQFNSNETATYMFGDAESFYLKSGILFVIGCLWFDWAKDLFKRLQNLPKSAWNCPRDINVPLTYTDANPSSGSETDT